MDQNEQQVDRKKVAQEIEKIENEMKRIHMWQDDPLPSEKYEFKEAFASDTMTFNQWLQFIFVPRVHEVLDTNGGFPPRSMVSTKAIREFDGYDEAGELVKLLSEFDDLINKQ